MCHKFFEGDLEGAREMQLKYLPLINALFSEVNPIPVKAAMKLLGYDCGQGRLPLTPAGEKTVEMLRKALSRF